MSLLLDALKGFAPVLVVRLAAEADIKFMLVDAEGLVRGVYDSERREDWEALEANRIDTNAPFFAKQEKIVLANSGRVDPEKLSDYLAAHGYQALARALTEMKPEEVLAARRELDPQGGVVRWRALPGARPGGGQLNRKRDALQALADAMDEPGDLAEVLGSAIALVDEHLPEGPPAAVEALPRSFSA